jgi:hypothetical protein
MAESTEDEAVSFSVFRTSKTWIYDDDTVSRQRSALSF